jgi:hypothetical protein
MKKLPIDKAAEWFTTQNKKASLDYHLARDKQTKQWNIVARNSVTDKFISFKSHDKDGFSFKALIDAKQQIEDSIGGELLKVGK